MKKLILALAITVLFVCTFSLTISAASCEHSFDSEEIVKEPTCQSIGYTTKTCTLCSKDVITNKTEKIEHSYIDVSKALDDTTGELVKTQKCKWCETENTDRISLVNKCYIEGYEDEIYDATMEYFSISSTGVCTPADGVTWDKNILYFPAYVEQNGTIVRVTTIQGFKKIGGTQSISEIYVPDTVTSLPYVGGGVFGDLNSLKAIVVGKGVTEIPQECFSIGGGCSLEKFIFKGTITSVGQYSFQQVGVASGFDWTDSSVYEFNTALTNIEKFAFIKSNIIRAVNIAPNATYIGQQAFNDANSLQYVYISGGTKENPVSLPMDIFSTDVQTHMTMVIDGYVVSGARAVIQAGKLDIYVDSVDVIKTWVASAVAVDSNYNNRFSLCTFMICAEQKAYQVTNRSQNYDEIVVTEVDGFKHADYTDTIVTSAPTCTVAGSKSIVNRCCGITSIEEIEPTGHNYDGGVITLASSCMQYGTLTYTCLECDETHNVVVGFDISVHSYDENEYIDVIFENYLDKGTKVYSCLDCELEVLENEPSFPAIYTSRGYSAEEGVTGNGIVFSVEVNMEAVEKYISLGNKMNYGIFVSVSSKPIVDANNIENGLMGDMTNTKYNILQIKVTNISADKLDTAIYCSAYVIANGKVYYVNDKSTTEEAIAVTYNSLKD